MNAPEDVQYRICPRCARAVPARSGEQCCINDGERLLEVCPRCEAAITNPYARHCSNCGFKFAQVLEKPQAMNTKGNQR